MVLGTMPFSGETEDDIINGILKKKVKFNTEKPLSKEFKDIILKLLTKDPEQRITLFDLQSHPWMEIDDEDLEASIEESKNADEEEKKEEEDVSYLEKLSLDDAKAHSVKPNLDPNSLSLNKNKDKKNSSPRPSSPRFSKSGVGSLNGSLKKKSKPVKKKKKPTK